MRRVLLFEPWHLGDVAVALSIIKQFKTEDVLFSMVCDEKWKEWVISTGLVNKVFPFSPAWTMRKQRDKYNPFNYSLGEILRFRKEVLNYHPDMIIDLRGDIRAKLLLKFLFSRQSKVISKKLPANANVYERKKVLQDFLGSTSSTNCLSPFTGEKITVFFGASDKNRIVPQEQALEVVSKLHKEGYCLNWILQPSDNLNELEQIKKTQELINLQLIKGRVVDVCNTIKDSSLVVSTDSGWLHVSFFYNIPVVGLFGFDTMKAWLPPGAKYITSRKVYPDYYRYKRKYQELQPLALIDVDQVVRYISHIRKGAVVQNNHRMYK